MMNLCRHPLVSDFDQLTKGSLKMFCPNCGNQAAGDQKFCRSCGMNLQKVAPALTEHLAEFGTGQSKTESAKDLRHLAMRRVIWGVAVIFAGIKSKQKEYQEHPCHTLQRSDDGFIDLFFTGRLNNDATRVEVATAIKNVASNNVRNISAPPFQNYTTSVEQGAACVTFVETLPN